MENFNIHTYVRQLKIIYFAVIGTPIMIAILFFLTFSEPQREGHDNESLFIFAFISFVFALFTFVLSNIIPPQIIKNQLKPDMPLSQKITIYKSYFILKLGLSEGSSFVYIMFLMTIEHQIFLIGFFVFTALIMFTLRPPTMEKIIQTLKLSPNEVAQLN